MTGNSPAQHGRKWYFIIVIIASCGGDLAADDHDSDAGSAGSPGVGGSSAAAGAGGASGDGGDSGCALDCGANASCVGSDGGQACQCHTGYAYDGAICKDVDECSSGMHNCHVYANCLNITGGFKCECQPGFVGDGTSCVPAGNYTCSSPTVISSVPTKITGSTVAASNELGYPGGSCTSVPSALGFGAPEHVFAFTPPSSGDYRVSLTGQDFDSTLYVANDCASVGTTCVGAIDQNCSNCTESLALGLSGGTPVHIVVDGWSNTDASNAGSYILDVVRLGECDSPFSIDAVPATVPGSTVAAPSNHSFSPGACSGYLGGGGTGDPENVYSFSPPYSGLYEISVTAHDFDSATYVATNCGAVDGTCIAAVNEPCANCSETLTIATSAALTYYIIVDGQGTGAANAGSYTLNLHAVDFVGDTCANPYTIGSVPFTATGNTTGANPDYGYASGVCPGESLGWGKGAPDHVYAFVPTVTKQYTVSLTGTAFDSSLFIVSDCAAIDSSCIGASEEKCFNCTETISAQLVAGTPYFIIVDGWEPFDTNLGGSYTLAVD